MRNTWTVSLGMVWKPTKLRGCNKTEKFRPFDAKTCFRHIWKLSVAVASKAGQANSLTQVPIPTPQGLFHIWRNKIKVRAEGLWYLPRFEGRTGARAGGLGSDGLVLWISNPISKASKPPGNIHKWDRNISIPIRLWRVPWFVHAFSLSLKSVNSLHLNPRLSPASPL